MAKMIGLDMGASGWRAGYFSDTGVFVPLKNRFVNQADQRRLPYITKQLIPEAKQGETDYQILCDNDKRFLGGNQAAVLPGGVNPREELTRQLADVFDDIAEQLGTKCLGAVIPLPSCFHERERAGLVEAAKQAGFELVHVPEESTMIVNSVPDIKQDTGPLFYFHLGASTLNIGVFVKDDNGGFYSEKCYYGNKLLGGDDFDSFIMLYVLEQARRIMEIPTAWELRDYINKELFLKCEEMRRQVNTNPAVVASIPVGLFKSTKGKIMPRSDATVEISMGVFIEKTAVLLLRHMDEQFSRILKDAQQKGIQVDQIKTVLIAGDAAIKMPFIWQNLFKNIEARTIDSSLIVRAASMYALKLQPELEEIEKSLPVEQVLPRRNLPTAKPKSEDDREMQETAPLKKRTPLREIPAPLKAQTTKTQWAKYANAIIEAEQVNKENPSEAILRLNSTIMELLELVKEVASRNERKNDVFRFQLIWRVADITQSKLFYDYPDVMINQSVAYSYLEKSDFNNARNLLEKNENTLKEKIRNCKTGKNVLSKEDENLIKSARILEAMNYDIKGVLYQLQFERDCYRAQREYDDIYKRRYCSEASKQLEKAANEYEKAIAVYKMTKEETQLEYYVSRYKKIMENYKECAREAEFGPKESINTQETKGV